MEKRKLWIYGYFIAKVRYDNMKFLQNRFSEKYPKKDTLNVRFFDENPLSIRRIRYNQSGAVCYCMENQEQARQKISNSWEPIACTDDCKYRLSVKENTKPMCNLEGILKFLLPEISQDRVWTMKITGYTSIQRLKAYFELQKILGNSLIGDYTIFLKQEEQIKNGKIYKNYILDIMKKEDFDSNNSISENQTTSSQSSTNNSQNVDNNPGSSQNDISKKAETVDTTEKNQQTSPKTKSTEQNSASKASKKPSTQKEQKDNQSTQESFKTDDEFKNQYLLVDTFTKDLMKDGKPTKYLIANFADMGDKTFDVVIRPEFADELLKCDVGTRVILDLKTIGDKTFTNSIKYVEKILKDVAA